MKSRNHQNSWSPHLPMPSNFQGRGQDLRFSGPSIFDDFPDFWRILTIFDHFWTCFLMIPTSVDTEHTKFCTLAGVTSKSRFLAKNRFFSWILSSVPLYPGSGDPYVPGPPWGVPPSEGTPRTPKIGSWDPWNLEICDRGGTLYTILTKLKISWKIQKNSEKFVKIWKFHNF